jgi:hypothetical protein
MAEQEPHSQTATGNVPAGPPGQGAESGDGRPVYVPPPAYDVVDRGGSPSLIRELEAAVAKNVKER